MQAKDVPEGPILEFLSKRTEWAIIGSGDDRDVLTAMPEGTPYKVGLAKMSRLIDRGLVSGCACGCRGDFEITPKGRDRLAKREDKGG